jgi:hypothetical protein
MQKHWLAGSGFTASRLRAPEQPASRGLRSLSRELLRSRPDERIRFRKTLLRVR